jgi:hypothetical protein
VFSTVWEFAKMGMFFMPKKRRFKKYWYIRGGAAAVKVVVAGNVG